MDLTLDINGLSNDGRGLARVPGEKIVFVAGALPGERVEARLIAERKAYREAVALRLISPSPHAVEPVCQHAGECGGCPLMRLDYQEQLVWKTRFVHDAMVRTAGLENPPMSDIRPSPTLAGCRNRVELAFGTDEDGQFRLGMRRRNSHSIVRAGTCAMMPAAMHTVRAKLEELFAASGLPVYEPAMDEADTGTRRRGDRVAKAKGYLRFCQLRTGRVPDELSLQCADHVPAKEGVWVLLLTSPGSRNQQSVVRRLATELMLACPSVHACIHEERKTPDLLVRGEKRLFAMGRPEDRAEDPALMIMPLDGRGYLTDAADFFQVNTAAADILCQTAREACACTADPASGPLSLFDCYCGVGAPGLSLGAGRLTGVEYSRSAVAMAARNARRFGLKGQYEAGDAAKVLARPLFQNVHAPVLLCDPPRGGLAPSVIDYLRGRDARRLIYISCNPVTLARDIKALTGAFRPVRVTPVDLFPHTPHVECVVLLSRVEAG